MTRYMTRDRVAIVAAIAAPLAAAVILLPWRSSWSNTNVALLLVASAAGGRHPGRPGRAGAGICGVIPGVALTLGLLSLLSACHA